MNKAIIITGPTCSGKTTLSRKLSTELNIPLITEENYPSGLIDMLNNLKLISNKDIIFEHSEISIFLPEIKKYFNTIVCFYLNVSDELLIDNYQNRIRHGATGDYQKLDVIGHKKMIEKNLMKLSNENMIVSINISNYDSYIQAYNYILSSIKQSNI